MGTITVYPIPSAVEAQTLSGAVAVVIDVLRATSVLTFAVRSGVKEIIPVLNVADAKQLRQQFPPESVLLGGERFGLPIDGFDLGNSPQHYTPEVVGGKTLIFTTTNGTAAIHAAAKGTKTIFLASFLNAAAVIERIKNEGNIVILCAGTDGQETEEDLLLAGCLTARLIRQQGLQRFYRLNETAEKVLQLWQEPAAADLIRQLRQSTGGENLIRIGLEADIGVAAQIDSIDVVPTAAILCEEAARTYVRFV
ncbi:MAG: 2-phosphosulfolactate phosphatase [Planctomycetaceae bacterium]|nr:2-phosphosulfolactate phosphatase [Planctomycetaceae bacterium]